MLRLNHWASRSRPHTAAAALILATGIIIISILPEIWDRWSSVGLSVMKFQFDWKMLAPTSPHISKHGICYGNVSFSVVYDLWSVGTFLYILLYLYVSIAHLWTGRAICYSVPEMSGLSVWHGGQGGWRRARELWHGQNILPLNIIQQQRCQNILRNIAQ